MEIGTSSDKKLAFAGLDIGGSLSKFCLWFATPSDTQIPHINDLKILTKKGDIYFNIVPNDKIKEFISTLKSFQEFYKVQSFFVTGGGAYKFQELLEKELGSEIIKFDEMKSLERGLQFLINYVDDFAFHFRESTGIRPVKAKPTYPFILANIGSGVSILKFDSINDYKRISGTALGGGTFLGFSHLLLGTNDFEEVLALAKEGKSENVDLLIKDIYPGQSSPHEELKSENIAVSLGKVVTNHLNKQQLIKKEDLAKALLKMIAFNISQIAYLNAKLHKTKMVYFAGNFIRNHTDTMECISYALDYFSKNDDESIEAVFLKHDGYLGALGCLLKSIEHEKVMDSPERSGKAEQ